MYAAVYRRRRAFDGTSGSGSCDERAWGISNNPVEITVLPYSPLLSNFWGAQCLTYIGTKGSRFWVLPIYVWGLEASLRIDQALFGAACWIGPHHYMLVFYEVFLALFILVCCQSLAVLRIDRPSITLGLRGHRNLACAAVLLAILLTGSTFLLTTQLS